MHRSNRAPRHAAGFRALTILNRRPDWQRPAVHPTDMHSKKPTETQKSDPTPDPFLIANRGFIIGALAGLILTVFAGHWLSNTLLLGSLGFIIGALFDRHRR